MDEPKLKDELLKMMQNDAYVQAVVAFDKVTSRFYPLHSYVSVTQSTVIQ